MNKYNNSKGFAPILILIGILGVGLLFVIGTICFRTYSIQQFATKYDQLSKKQVELDKQSELAKQASNSAAQTPFVINKQNLIGIWHQCNSMPAGWCDHYHFYSSGKYSLYKSANDCTKTITDESGLWKLQGFQLELTVKEQTILKGGKLVKSGICAGGQNLEGGTPEKVMLSLARSEIYSLKPIVKNNSEFTDVIYEGVYFNNKDFWKFSNDPLKYGEQKFLEPTDF